MLWQGRGLQDDSPRVYEAAYKDSKGKRDEMLVTADGKEVKEQRFLTSVSSALVR